MSSLGAYAGFDMLGGSGLFSGDTGKEGSGENMEGVEGVIGDLVEKMDAKVSRVVEKLWLVCASQSDEAKAYCFDNDKCGKAMIGGVRIEGIPFFACQTACCPYLKDELEMGEFILPYTGQRDLVVRKLTAAGE